MENECPKCGKTLIINSIKKKLTEGTITFPIAKICPNCKWKRDLTGAGDMSVPEPLELDYHISAGIDNFIPAVLAIIVAGIIVWVFLM